ncbi:MAG: dihydrodipicolinate synthase family protein [Alicyclobacillus sp.]|nr:dihydrodipicolinate synthase family protein [Alicyclobacillus sp.]
MLSLNGVSAALVTPLTPSGVDTETAARLIEALSAQGVRNFVVMGTTGEALSLSIAERRQLLEGLVSTYGSRLLVGTGFGNDLADTVRFSNLALSLGAAGVIVITPSFGVLSDDQLHGYFDELARAVAGPIVLYDFPEMTGNRLRPQTVAELATTHPHIVGLKLTDHHVGHLHQMLHTVLAARPDFQVVVGYEELLLPGLAAGAVGTISGMANFAGDVLVQLTDAFAAGDVATALSLHRRIVNLARLYDLAPAPIAITKYAAHLRHGIPDSPVKPPNLHLTQDAKSDLAATIRRYFPD